MNKASKVLLLLSLAWASYSVANSLTPELQQAKQRGIEAYQTWHCEKAVPLLTKPAEAGDSDSQYYIGDCILQDYTMMNNESSHWFTKAAEQGDIYAMMRLGETDALCKKLNTCDKQASEWHDKAMQLATQKAAQGDSEAMYQLYLMTDKLSWLEKSAEANYAVAQYKLSTKYSEGHGTFLLSSRQEAEDKWLKAAADNNYPPAMVRWGDRLMDLDKKDEAKEYILKAANMGDTTSLFSYAMFLGYTTILPDKENYSGIKENKIQSYGLMSLLAEIQDPNARYALKKLSEHMTSEQIEQGKAYAQEWQKTHPPLSLFRHKYWYPSH